MRPDHEQLPPHVRDAVDAELRARAAELPDVWQAPAPERSGNGLGTVLVALVLAVLAAAVLVLAALFASTIDSDGLPAPVQHVSTIPTPCSTGGAWC